MSDRGVPGDLISCDDNMHVLSSLMTIDDHWILPVGANWSGPLNDDNIGICVANPYGEYELSKACVYYCVFPSVVGWVFDNNFKCVSMDRDSITLE